MPACADKSFKCAKGQDPQHKENKMSKSTIGTAVAENLFVNVHYQERLRHSKKPVSDKKAAEAISKAEKCKTKKAAIKAILKIIK